MGALSNLNLGIFGHVPNFRDTWKLGLKVQKGTKKNQIVIYQGYPCFSLPMCMQITCEHETLFSNIVKQELR